MPRVEEWIEHHGCDRLIEQSQSHGERVPARLRAAMCGENTLRIGLETERPDLRTIGFGVETEALGNRQPGLAEAREIRGLRAKAAGVSRLGGGDGGDQLRHDSGL